MHDDGVLMLAAGPCEVSGVPPPDTAASVAVIHDQQLACQNVSCLQQAFCDGERTVLRARAACPA